jgi:hypothetical protein
MTMRMRGTATRLGLASDTACGGQVHERLGHGHRPAANGCGARRWRRRNIFVRDHDVRVTDNKVVRS